MEKGLKMLQRAPLFFLILTLILMAACSGNAPYLQLRGDWSDRHFHPKSIPYPDTF